MWYSAGILKGEEVYFYIVQNNGLAVTGRSGDSDGQGREWKMDEERAGGSSHRTCRPMNERLIVRSMFGEVCCCCCLPALPGPDWVLLSYVLHTILCTSVHMTLIFLHTELATSYLLAIFIATSPNTGLG